jgi:transposase-like protein
VAGERVSTLSEESGVSPATLHLWKRQALIDAGLKAGTKSVEVDELAQARRTIEELEAELEAVKAATWSA